MNAGHLRPANFGDPRLAALRELRRRKGVRHPLAFRQRVRIGPLERLPIAVAWQPWQEADFAALDAAWLAMAGRGPEATIRRAYIERPRGHSKTTDIAVQLAWILQAARSKVTGVAAAADQDQAALIRNAVADLVRCNSDLCPDLDVRAQGIRHRRTGSELKIITSDVNSSYGHLVDFVVCDELCHWTRPELWYSLCSTAAKKPHGVLIVLTNAGTGTGWQWQARETARISPEWHFSSLAGPQAPWITGPNLAEQRRLLPPAVYARLWDNVWQHSDGEFVTLAEAEACRDSERVCQEKGRPRCEYIAAVDYAEKHDRTVGVVLHREGHALIVDRMDVAAPSPGQPVLVQWVEDWIAEIAAKFPHVRFVLDEYQLLGVIQRLSGRWPIQRFDFGAGLGNHQLAMTLRQLIVHRQVRWYPGCGQLPGVMERDDLETELSSLLLKETTSGRVRIDHRRASDSHDDRAFALGAACLQLVRNDHGGESWMTVTEPDGMGGFAL